MLIRRDQLKVRGMRAWTGVVLVACVGGEGHSRSCFVRVDRRWRRCCCALPRVPVSSGPDGARFRFRSDFGVNLCPSNVMNDRNVRMKRRQARNPSRNPGIRKRNPAEAVSTSFPRVRVRRDRDAVTRMHGPFAFNASRDARVTGSHAAHARADNTQEIRPRRRRVAVLSRV